MTLTLKTIELLHIGNLSEKRLPRAATGEGAPRSSTQSSTRSHGQEQMMSHCACKRRLKEFEAISGTYQNSHMSKNVGCSPGVLLKIGQFRALANSPEIYTRQSWKQLVIHLQACRRRPREFGAISGTYQNPPCSKLWAIAQAFCSKSASFGPLRIQPKCTQTILQVVSNPFASM